MTGNPHQPLEAPTTTGTAKPRPKHRVARNMVFSLMSLLIATPLNIVGMLLAARRLGKDVVGVSFSVFAVAIVIYILSGSGVATVLTRRIARGIDDAKRHIAEATGILLLVCIASFPLIMGAGVVWSAAKGMPNTQQLFLLAAVAIAGRHVMEFGVGALRGLERFEFETITRLVQNGSFCAIVVAYVTKERGAESAVMAFAVSHWIAAAMSSAVLFFGFGCRQIILNRKTITQWYGESLPLGWGDAVRGLGWHVDTILLSLLGSNAAVGIYNVAFRPLMPLRSLPRALASATFPLMSRMRDDKERMAAAFSRSINVLWFTALPICIAITGCAKNIVLLLATAEFAEATLPLQLMIWITISLFITTQYRFLFTALDRQGTYSLLVTSALIIKAAALCYLIPKWGIYGAVAGSLAIESLLLVAGFQACRSMGVARVPWGRMARAIPAAAVMAGMLYLSRDWSWPQNFAMAAAGGVVYVLLSVVFGVLDASEMERIGKLLRGLRQRLTPGKPAALPDGAENRQDPNQESTLGIGGLPKG